MQPRPLRTTVIGSYPFPSWLELASQNLDSFGIADLAETQDDAVVCALHDQLAAGLDVVTDGEQTRLDFNLSFYGFLDGISLESQSPRRFGPPAHDQRGKHAVVGQIGAPRGLGVVDEYKRLERLYGATSHGESVTLKASIPGPYTMSGRLIPNADYPDRWTLTDALLPLITRELELLVEAGCREITLDEPSMSCYAYKEDTKRFVEIFNRTVAPIVGKTRLSTHLCFGNFKSARCWASPYCPDAPRFSRFFGGRNSRRNGLARVRRVRSHRRNRRA